MKKISNADTIKYGKRLLLLGIVCVLAALSLFVYNKIMDRRAGSFSRSVMQEIKNREEQSGTEGQPDGHSDGRSDSAALSDDPARSIGDTGTLICQGYNFMGYLTIPTLRLELPVMSDWNYDKLNLSPCRYSGSVITGDLVIAAHNYRSHFGGISALVEGDSVIFTDVNGRKYHYQVQLTETLEPTQIGKMTAGEYDLSLFTCNLTGVVRVTVRCDRVYR